MARLTPLPALLNSIRNQNLPWSIIFGEFIDNAFDAGADRVVVTVGSKSIEVEDNGQGCKEILLILTPGGRSAHVTTQLGRYGIGAKDAMISAADEVVVSSIHRGVLRTANCDWRKLSRQSEWDIDDPLEVPTEKPSGTRVSMRQLRTKETYRIRECLERLSLMYTPAIKQGRQIIFKPSQSAPAAPVPEYKFPPLEHQMTQELCVDRKLVRVTMGLVSEGHSCQEVGLVLSYGYRVIKTNQRLGLGDQPTPGLFGWVELLEGWELTKNKDNVSSSIDALDRAIFASFQSVIALAAKRAHVIPFQNVTKSVNQLLKEFAGEAAQKDRKAVRKPKQNQTGTVPRKNTGVRHTRAACSQPGQTFQESMRSGRGLEVSFGHFGADGPASKYSDGMLYLNVDIPAISTDATDERSLTRHAIYAASLYFAVQNRDNPLFPEAEGDFDRAARISGHLLTRIGDAGLMETIKLNGRRDGREAIAG